MNDKRASVVDTAAEIRPPDPTTRLNGRPGKVSDDALSELAKIGAEDVRGVRVESARVEDRNERRVVVGLVVDVEYSDSLSSLVEKVCDGTAANIRKHLSDVETIETNVTIASVRRLSARRDRYRQFWGNSVGSMKDALGPWIVPFLVLGFGVLVLWAITRFVNQTETSIGDVVLASLLVMPILIYAIVSGKLTEFKGPGGVEAKFTATATRPVAETASHDSVSIDELITVAADTGQEQLWKRVQRFTEIQPIVMTITMGAVGYQEGSENDHQENLKTYVEQLSRSRNFALVAFLDTNNNFVAYMPSWVVKNKLDDEDTREELFGVIKRADREGLYNYAGVVRDKVSPSATNGEALRKMVESNLDIIVVVDENNRLKGVIEREQLLSRMVLTLTPSR